MPSRRLYPWAIKKYGQYFLRSHQLKHHTKPKKGLKVLAKNILLQMDIACAIVAAAALLKTLPQYRSTPLMTAMLLAAIMNSASVWELGIWERDKTSSQWTLCHSVKTFINRCQLAWCHAILAMVVSKLNTFPFHFLCGQFFYNSYVVSNLGAVA